MLNLKLMGLIALLFPLFSYSNDHKCEIWEDAERITHVKAASADLEGFCFGYAHGKERAFQMDYFRRTANGKNAEVHGFSQLKNDMTMRLLDLPYWGQKLWNEVQGENRKYILSYVEGVNVGFKEAQKNPFAELKSDYPKIEPWTAEDSMIVILLQSFDQTRKTFSTEIEEEINKAQWKEKTLHYTDSEGLPWDTTIIKKDELKDTKKTNTFFEKKKSLSFASDFKFPSLFGEESGSNNWVVSAEKSQNKIAMLANDPHLDLRTPLFWHWIHIEAPPSVNAIGASLPGVPAIVSGANLFVSWGLTNSYYNTADAVLLEKAEEKELKSFFPLVWVKWKFLKIPIFFKRFQKTEEGFPILPVEIKELDQKVALKWAGFHVQASDLDFLQTLNKVKNISEANSVFKSVGVPSWNFVFADVQGDIGYRTVGNLYKATQQNEAGIHQGGLKYLREKNFLSPDERPSLLNPKRGWIVTANNRHFPETSSFYGERGYAEGFRAQRIEELVSKNSQHDLSSFQKAQCDIKAQDAVFHVPLILAVLEESEWDLIKKDFQLWNMQTDIDCQICGVYRNTMRLVFEELNINDVGFYRLGLEKNPDWVLAVKKNLRESIKTIGPKKWGEIHQNSFLHFTPREDWKFSLTIPTPGDKHTVNPGSSRWNEKTQIYDHNSGASQRFIALMGKTPELWLALPGINTRYDQHDGKNPWKSWAQCEYFRVNWPINWIDKPTQKIY